MSNYESIYTGSQIDTAVGRASVGGAIDSSLSNKADSSTHNLKTYTSLEQIGLNYGSETMASIFSALPSGTSLLMAGTSACNTISDGSGWPVVNSVAQRYGQLRVDKISSNRSLYVFSSVVGIVWFGTYYTSWGGWQQIATATTPTEYDLPLVEGFTSLDGYECKYSKSQEGIVTLNFIIQGPINGTYSRMANLPVGFRPSETITMLVTSSSATNVDLGRVIINATGAVSVQFKGSNTSGNFGGSGTFIASN